ncbi:recombinase family protein [Brucella pituitosa]|uniref:Recombinase family protein n=1 Tax=Brucella pituitosa TaxID=571256 RepID=A0A643EXB3_9HYPH|nr:recombinase family protein [Brucella pituitosa]KAB0568797.1 recombinase family protein [Brucella pituitosa]
MQNLGYARVSTTEQNLDLQLSALRAVGCHAVLTDEGISGSEFTRPGLSKLLKQLRAGDTLTVWRLDRLGRSLFNLIKLVRELEERGIQFRSLSESIDTGTPGGRLLFHLLAAMAEFERSLVSERTRAGMAAARARGSRIGRKPAMSPEQIAEATSAFVDDGISLEDLAKHYSIHPRTLKSKMRLISLVGDGVSKPIS